MLLDAQSPEREIRQIKALIDTGAEANLVRQGLFSRNLFVPARNPVRLVAANGQRLGGGEYTIDLELGFNMIDGTVVGGTKVEYAATCYEADIAIDMILSFP